VVKSQQLPSDSTVCALLSVVIISLNILMDSSDQARRGVQWLMLICGQFETSAVDVSFFLYSSVSSCLINLVFTSSCSRY